MQDLTLPFVKNTEENINRIQQRLELLKEEFEEYKAFLKNDSIPVGARVKSKNFEEAGRLARKNSQKCFVRRDGYEGEIGQMEYDLTNISLDLGFEGFLEMRIWQLNRNINICKSNLEDTVLPDILTENRFSVIHVPEMPTPGRKLIQYNFVHAGTGRAGTIKIPGRIIDREGYYQLEVIDKEIVDVVKTTELVFNSLFEGFRPN